MPIAPSRWLSMTIIVAGVVVLGVAIATILTHAAQPGFVASLIAVVLLAVIVGWSP